MANIDLPPSDEAARMELRSLVAYIWGGRKIIAYTIAVFFVLGLAWYRTTPRIYEATAVLSSAPGSSSGAAGGASALSGAARLIGIGGGGTAGVEFTKFQSLLDSSILADRLARDGMLQLMYPERWDARTHTWKQSQGLLSPLTNTIRSILGIPQKGDPSARDVQRMLHGSLVQNLSLQTSLLDLSMTSNDPAFAVTFLTMAHREADNILREKARTRSARRIDYLQKTLLNVTAIEQRAALIQLLNQETQTSMMIQSDPNYSADMVDPPSVSPDPISPKFSFVLIAAVIGGFVFGLVLYSVLRSVGLTAIKLQWNPLQWPAALRHRSP